MKAFITFTFNIHIYVYIVKIVLKVHRKIKSGLCLLGFMVIKTR